MKKPTQLGVVACGALAREIETIVRANRMDHIRVRYLAAKLHNSPREIAPAVARELEKLQPKCKKLLVAYGDCGTGGKLDAVLEQFGATRLQGAHCYAFYSGLERFDIMHDAEPGTFYLTDYLARQFDTLVFKPLGLDRHPELLESYFGNYTRLLYLAQSHDQLLDAKARAAANRLGLRFERLDTGFGLLQATIAAKAGKAA